jgi:N-acetylglucosamine-6-phosphate deacetylase
MSSGFVDIQHNGWMGTDFSSPDCTPERFKEIVKQLIEHGTTAFCPTIVTSNPDGYEYTFSMLAKAMKDDEIGPHLLGIHLEGPFISKKPGAVGAHPKQYVLEPSIEKFKQFQEWAEGNIKILTLAPGIPGAEELIKYASNEGVIVSMGHHYADDEQLAEAMHSGIKLATHLGNGIPNEIHRHNNPLWWELANDDLFCSFITDGHHLPADFIKVALRAKTVDKFIAISDASPLAGMPSGTYNIFGLEAVIDDTGLIFSPKTQGLVGSHSTIFECVNYLAGLNVLTETELREVAFDNPIKLLGRDPDEISDLPGPEPVFVNGQFVLR